ncbi:MAG: hypothetical protein FD153_1507 [Rhodospirillaceae bacterium]|nr:MAG: hypothetical protein FD153_1507 [Rhodospirillaceae bacterium]
MYPGSDLSCKGRPSRAARYDGPNSPCHPAQASPSPHLTPVIGTRAESRPLPVGEGGNGRQGSPVQKDRKNLAAVGDLFEVVIVLQARKTRLYLADRDTNAAVAEAPHYSRGRRGNRLPVLDGQRDSSCGRDLRSALDGPGDAGTRSDRHRRCWRNGRLDSGRRRAQRGGNHRFAAGRLWFGCL